MGHGSMGMGILVYESMDVGCIGIYGCVGGTNVMYGHYNSIPTYGNLVQSEVPLFPLFGHQELCGPDRVCGCMRVWNYGYGHMGVWVYGCMRVWKHGYGNMGV